MDAERRRSALDALPDWYRRNRLTDCYVQGWNDAIVGSQPYLVGCRGHLQRLAYLRGWGRQRKWRSWATPPPA